MRRQTIHRGFGILVTILSLGAVGRGQSAAPRHVDIYLLPLSADREYTAELQEYCRTTLHLETEVLPAFQPALSSWNARRSEWWTELLTEDVIEHVEDRLRSGHSTVIAITGDQLRSQREGWVFGWRNRAGVGILSYAALRPKLDSDADAEAILRTRLRRALARYIGLLHLNLQPSSDKRSLVAGTVNEVNQFDDMDDDPAAAGFFSHRPLLDYAGPVRLMSGVVQRRDLDLALDDTPRVTFERMYTSNDNTLRWLPFGVGTTHSYGSYLIGDPPTFSYIELILSDGSRIHYRRVTPGVGHDATFTYDGPVWASRLSWKNGEWLVEFPGGSSYTYPACTPGGRPCTISGYRDASGREIRGTFNANRDLIKVESEHHHTIGLAYNDDRHIVLAWDDSGGWTSYSYDARGRLTQADYPDGESREYTYDANNRMTRVHDRRLVETFEYDADGRCVRDEQRTIVYTDAAGHVFERVTSVDFDYVAPRGSAAMVQTVRMRSGTETRTVTFNTDGYPIGDVWGEGTPLEQRTTFDRRANNVVAKVTVLCGGARHLTAAADVTEGQSDAAISERLRRRCDVDLQRPRP